MESWFWHKTWMEHLTELLNGQPATENITENNYTTFTR
jgi:hypothetical protein